MMSEDAEEALVEIESGDTAGGYYTSTVVVFDEDRQKVEAAGKQIEKAINNAGFTARVESLNTMDALVGSLPGHGVQNVRRPYVSVFNLAHLIPTSSIWTGEEKAPCPMYPALSPALMHCVNKTQQDGFVFSRISVFDSCTRSSLTKLLPNVGFNGSIRPDIAGSPSSWKLESRPKPTPEEEQRHFSRAGISGGGIHQRLGRERDAPGSSWSAQLDT